MKKKTLLGVAAAAAVGAAGWYLAAGGRKNQIEHIRREAKRLLAVRRDELAALRSAAEEGELDAGALGPVPLDGAALESVRMEDGAAVLSLRGEKAAAWLEENLALDPFDFLSGYERVILERQPHDKCGMPLESAETAGCGALEELREKMRDFVEN